MEKIYKLKVWWWEWSSAAFFIGSFFYFLYIFGIPSARITNIKFLVVMTLIVYGLWWLGYALTYKFVLNTETRELVVMALGLKVKTYNVAEIKKYFFEGTLKEFNPGEVSQKYLMQKTFFPSGRYITHINLSLISSDGEKDIREYWNLDPAVVREIFEAIKKINNKVEEADNYFYVDNIFHKSLDGKYLFLVLITLLILFFYYFFGIFLKK